MCLYSIRLHWFHLGDNLTEEEIDMLRRQATIFMVQQLVKNPQFLFNVSMGIKHFFQEFGKGDVKLGILYLEYRKELEGEDKNCGYFKNTWFDSLEEAGVKANEIQEKKVYDEDKIFNYFHSYIEEIYNPKPILYS